MKEKSSGTVVVNDSPLALKIIGAKEHNLKNISLDVPANLFVVVTGLSGSGKSSLAFSTIYAEGQRRYIETFSPYTRQFFDKVKKPDVTSIENVRPSIAIQQKTRVSSSRSTVGSMTNCNDLLKVLWSNLATPYSPVTGAKLVRWNPYSVYGEVKCLLNNITNSVIICAFEPHYAQASSKNKRRRLETVSNLMKQGFVRYFDENENKICRLEDITKTTDISAPLLLVLDRITNNTQDDDAKSSITQAFALTNDGCVLVYQDESGDWRNERFSSSYSSTDPSERDVKFSVPPPRPALFSYNSPIGACPECKGFGIILEVDASKVVPDPRLSIAEGALQCWNGPAAADEFLKLIRFCKNNKIDKDVAWCELCERERGLIFEHSSRDYKGVRAWFKWIERKSYKMHVRVFLSRFRGQFTCPACNGMRIKEQALYFRLNGKTLPELWDMPIKSLVTWIRSAERLARDSNSLEHNIEEVFERLVGRLAYLENLGLGYLTLGRQSKTLSGGETQRVNLATAIGSELVSTAFVLDEPSVGLHPRDTERLIQSIRMLQSKGNSVIVVEHDLDCIDAADHIIELGPEAGAKGGNVTFNGKRSAWAGIAEIEDINKQPRKVTVPFLSTLSIRNATARNLKNVNIDIPVGYFTTITGVSGSGKSSLINEVILKRYQDYAHGVISATNENCVDGFENFSQVLMVDQSGLAKSPRANIATYSGIWNTIRILLATTEAAKLRSLDKSAFSFNVDGGRCPVCKGAGYIKEDMQFLSDVYVRCEVCLGRRFQEKPLEVMLFERNAFDWLETTVSECGEILVSEPQVCSTVQTLEKLGLGHLRLGHPLSELSGGESQRLKLVPVVRDSAIGESLLIFDEPTTGLHLNDVKRLIHVIHHVRDVGHTVICIEHNLEVVGASDWIIDLGPESSEEGGDVVFCGAPQELYSKLNIARSHTAKYFAEYTAQKARVVIGEGSLDINTCGANSHVSSSSHDTSLVIDGAREHNLKNISVSIPHNKFVALTGVSGSGKSTIAKDIIYAEGQRRYLDCLSPYARHFIRELSKPDIDDIRNVRPTVCVYQHTFQPTERSTVATLSEVYAFLRLLFSKIGDQFCPEHPNQLVNQISVDEITEKVWAYGNESIRLLAPIIKLKKGVHKATFQRAMQLGIDEVRVDGNYISPSKYASSKKYNEGLEKGRAHEIEYVTAHLVPTRLTKSLIKGAIEETLALGGGTIIVAGAKKGSDLIFCRERACAICNRGFFRPDPEDFSFHSKRGQCSACQGSGRGVGGRVCKVCQGARITEIGRHVRIDDNNIHDFCLLGASALKEKLSNIKWEEEQKLIASPVLREVMSRLNCLIELGLDYLPLDRSCHELSGGELQRLRLASAMGTPLTGAMYIFDEPSAGLHPTDNARVLKLLSAIKNAGNSVILIEHDADSIMSSEYVIEVGPGGGREGGTIIYEGAIDGFSMPESSCPKPHSKPSCSSADIDWIHITAGNVNNVVNANVSIPIKNLTTISGVSGSGKSSLLFHILLYTIGDSKLKDKTVWESERGRVTSDCALDRILVVDQTPVGKNVRSTPASYLKIWDEVRKVFATTIEAKANGWNASFFSYNTGDGRCDACKGRGRITLEMSFLTEASITCEQCGGSRFTDMALAIRFKGLCIADVLNLTFAEAKDVFANHSKIHRIVHSACELGLGYLTLGQGSHTLSGGESQRLKLVNELSRVGVGHTLYVLDEPTVGLHRKDVGRLVNVLRGLVRAGNTVVLIEHDTDVIAASDYVIEMGPGAGAAGGNVEKSNFYGHATFSRKNSKTVIV